MRVCELPRFQPFAHRALGQTRSALTALALGALLCTTAGTAFAQGTLRIAMTASDIPLPNGQTDQGAEGMRFMGYTVFEALVAYDLSSADKAAPLMPGLATDWQVDASDKLKWTFKLRPGVKFHDGSAFTAQSVVWNLDKILDSKAEQFDPKQAAQGRGRRRPPARCPCLAGDRGCASPSSRRTPSRPTSRRPPWAGSSA